MSDIADSGGRIEYPGSEYPVGHSHECQPLAGIHTKNELQIVVELVSVSGPEGQRLEELQAQAVRRVLETLLHQRERAIESQEE